MTIETYYAEVPTEEGRVIGLRMSVPSTTDFVDIDDQIREEIAQNAYRHGFHPSWDEFYGPILVEVEGE